MSKSLVIGAGEVGQALHNIFLSVHHSYIRDKGEMPLDGVEILHIAYPYSPQFILQTLKYTQQYNPALTVIHSSVPPGTTAQCGEHVVYSPVRGRHPNLVQELRLFKKFVGGYDASDVEKTCAFFEACGWKTAAYDDPRDLEMMKLVSNVHMGLEIAWRQVVERLVGYKARGVYQAWEDDYFKGYMELGQHHLIRPRMRPNPIGGHCILECIRLLDLAEVNKVVYPTKLIDFIMDSNERAKEDLCQTSLI